MDQASISNEVDIERGARISTPCPTPRTGCVEDRRKGNRGNERLRRVSCEWKIAMSSKSKPNVQTVPYEDASKAGVAGGKQPPKAGSSVHGRFGPNQRNCSMK